MGCGGRSGHRHRIACSSPIRRQGSIGFFVKVQENGAPALAGHTTQGGSEGQITEIETIVSRLSGTLGGGPPPGSSGRTCSATPRARSSPRRLPPDKRRTREELSQLVNGYFTGLENNTGDEPPSFAEDCLRPGKRNPDVRPPGRPKARSPVR